MELKSSDVIACINKARAVADAYRQHVLAGDHAKRSVDDLVEVATAYIGLPISVYELPVIAQSRSVKGLSLRFDDRIEIYLLNGMDEHWRRFVLCKELFHAINDERDCYSVQLDSHVEQCVAIFSIDDSSPDATTASEFLAEVAAMEFLFPLTERGAQVPDSGGADDFAAISTRYGIPQVFVEFYLAAHLVEELETLFKE